MKVSIVIPNFNGKHLLEKNLPKVIQACQKYPPGDWEIIVVDDASSDESVAFLKKNYPQVKLIVHKKNQYFAVSCNDGIEKAEGKIVVLLNNDVVPGEDFLKPLINNFADKKVFSVGCKEKSLQKGRIIFSGRAGGVFKKGFLVHWRAGDQDKKDTLWTAGGSAAFRKSLWLKLSGFDPLFRPAYGEDIDISYRALKSGFQILFEPNSEVFHQHETTNIEAFGEKKIKIYSFKNQFLFVWKNITDWPFLLSHLLWLPYHLIITNIKAKGLFLLGFFLALKQFPGAIKSRKRVIERFVLQDREVLKV